MYSMAKKVKKTKKEALAAFLGVEVKDISSLPYDGECAFQSEVEGEYLVLTDAEAEDRAVEYITDSLWAFNPEFIMDHLEKPVTGRAYEKLEESVKHAQETMCEDANTLVSALIGDNLEAFIDDAISADGRGHFMGGYDDEEHEQDGFFIYRTN
jgi:hypothetical protein